MAKGLTKSRTPESSARPGSRHVWEPNSATDEVLKLLESPDTYHERTSSVECLETHISWLFFTDHFVYKLKKPVCFDFLDFSTVDKRKLACRQEVELNRRLARDVYLGAVPIVRLPSGGLGFDRPGEPIDWVVKMHRLPAAKSLDQVSTQGALNARALDSLASRLTKFYSQLPPVSLAVADYQEQFERHVVANRDELLAASHHFERAQVERIQERQLRLIRLVPDLLADRVLDGRIIEGHGDLRPEHIFLTSPPVVIDCIEFSSEFRTLDVVDELSFLCMESDFLGANEIGRKILSHYLRTTGDQPPQLLLDFYRAYRACVRAKVVALRADQVPEHQRSQALTSAQQYLDLADQYTRQLGEPTVVVVRGLSGTGKSTIADMVSQKIAAPLLQTDAVRRKMFPGPFPSTAYNGGCYSPPNRRRVYQEMHAMADEYVAHGRSVVLDGTYLTAHLRQEVQDLAARRHARLVCIRCECADELAMERISSREQESVAFSDARPDFPLRQRRDEEPDPAGLETISVDTTLNTVEPIGTILAALRAACLPPQ